MASEHTLYSPKPAYDHLDHYRSGGAARGPGEEKLRRTGLSTVTPQISGGSEALDKGGDAPSSPLRPRPRQQMEMTPLSPPPSLDNVEEEDMEEEEEEDPPLPSTPESNSSLASSDTFNHAPHAHNTSHAPTRRGPSRLPRQMSMSQPDPPSPGPSTPSSKELTSPSSLDVAPPSPQALPDEKPATQQEEEEKEKEKEEEGETNNTKKERVFPSLHDTYLRTAGLLRDDPAFTSNENLSAQEIENKFTQLSLAFKTDRLTLRQRLDLQQRHRDTAESNLENEFKHLRSSVLALHADCMDSELVDAVTQVRRHLDVLAASSNRLISTSEVWGAVQQEWRVSRALEVLFLHVDNVKRMYEQDHKELEELRRLLKECQIELPGQGQLANGPGGNNQTSTDSPVASRRLRALSLAICSTRAAQSSETRRVSVASSSSSKSSASGFAGSARSRNRRASLMPDLKPFRELAGFTAAALTASRESSSSSSSASGLSVPKESAEEGTASSATTSGRWSCSITEEVNESGEEDAGSTHDTTSSTTSNAAATTGNNNNNDDDDSTPGLPGLTPANIAALSHLHPDFQLEDDLLTDSEERDSDDSDHSEISQAPSEELKPSLPTFLDRFWARSRPPPWVLVAVEGLIGWAKGGQWPYSQQQTVQGARYAFTSLLLLVAALFLLVTLSSGDASIPQPRHPGWTTMNHLLHPFVTLRYLQTPPT